MLLSRTQHLTKALETYVEANLSVTGKGDIPSFVDIWHYWTTGAYLASDENINSSLNGGLAEYTTANFLSENKMLDTYKHPSEDDGSVVLCDVISKDGKTDKAYYFKMDQGAKVEHLAHSNILGKFGIHVFDNLDTLCYADYAKLLVPKAVDYSTGLINYFFRGTLGIWPPERWVYSIADGSLDPPQFSYIKAQVYNSTDYNGGGDPPMGPGSLWAVARYKMGEDTYLYSVSEPIEDVTVTVELQEFEFSFASDPIPADVTDLTLQVVYKGTLGSEQNTAVAVGMKDLNEPSHFVVFNATDYAFFAYNGADPPEGYYYVDDNMFNTAADMESGGPKPAECTRNASTNTIECTQGVCGSTTTPPLCVYPVDSTVDIEFYPGVKTVTTPHLTYYPLPPGRHGRMIVLGDPDISLKANIVISASDEFPYQSDYPCKYCEIETVATVDSIVAQGVEPVPQNASFRDISMHNGIMWNHFNWVDVPDDFSPPTQWNCDASEMNMINCYMYDRVYPYWPAMANPDPWPFDSN